MMISQTDRRIGSAVRKSLPVKCALDHFEMIVKIASIIILVAVVISMIWLSSNYQIVPKNNPSDDKKELVRETHGIDDKAQTESELPQDEPNEEQFSTEFDPNPPRALGRIGSALHSLSIEDGIKFVATIPVGPMLDYAYMILAPRLAEESPERALKWLDSLPSDPSSVGAYSALGRELMKYERGRLLSKQYVRKISDAGLRQHFAGSMLKELPKHDMTAAKELAEEEGLFLSKSIAHSGLASGLLEAGKYEEAASLVFTEDDVQPTAVSELARRWGQDDPQAALTWLTEYSDNSNQLKVAKGVISEWSRTNAVEASEWLVDIPQGDFRDELVESFTSTIYRSQPREALGWISTISNREMQLELAKKVLATSINRGELHLYAEELNLIEQDPQ